MDGECTLHRGTGSRMTEEGVMEAGEGRAGRDGGWRRVKGGGAGSQVLLESNEGKGKPGKKGGTRGEFGFRNAASYMRPLSAGPLRLTGHNEHSVQAGSVEPETCCIRFKTGSIERNST